MTRVGLEIVELHKTSGSAEAAAQMLSVYFHRVLGRSIPVWSSIVTAVICAPTQLWGMLWQRILPETGELFLDTAVLAIKPNGAEQ